MTLKSINKWTLDPIGCSNTHISFPTAHTTQPLKSISQLLSQPLISACNTISLPA